MDEDVEKDIVVVLPPKRTYVASVEIVGRNVFRTDALCIARQILDDAERERAEAAELEAKE